jgi:hypothetical protein
MLRIAVYVNPRDEKTRQEMDSIIAQSAEYRSRNDYIWTAIKKLNKLYLSNEKNKE